MISFKKYIERLKNITSRNKEQSVKTIEIKSDTEIEIIKGFVGLRYNPKTSEYEFHHPSEDQLAIFVDDSPVAIIQRHIYGHRNLIQINDSVFKHYDIVKSHEKAKDLVKRLLKRKIEEIERKIERVSK